MVLMEKKKNYMLLGLVIFLLAVLVIFIFYLLQNSLTIFIVSILIAFIFKPIVDFLEKRKIPRALSVFIIFALIAIILFGSLYFLIPQLISQFKELAENFNDERINLSLGQIENELKLRFPFLAPINLSSQIAEIFHKFLKGITNNFSQIFYNIFSFTAVLVIIPFITFFLLKDSNKLTKGILSFFPKKYYNSAQNVLTKIILQLSRYVRGWILDAAIVGTLVAIGLSILGINNFISIGFIAGIGHLIPYLGPIIGGIPAIIISLIQFGNFSMLPALVILFAIIYSVDNGFIQPNIFSKNTDLHPVVIIFLILAGGEILGVIGMLIAVPITTVLKSAVKEILIELEKLKSVESNK